MEEQGTELRHRVRAFRERRGWSLAQLGAHAGLDPTTIWKIETGRTANPGNRTVHQISAALGVSPSQITGEQPLPRRRVKITGNTAEVPLMLLRVQADSNPTWGDTTDDVIVSADTVRGRPNVFSATVAGECMVPVVMPGERVVIDPDARPIDRDMVVITDDEGATLVKWFRVDSDGGAYLRAEDGSVIKPNGGRVEGVVIAIERRSPRDAAP